MSLFKKLDNKVIKINNHTYRICIEYAKVIKFRLIRQKDENIEKELREYLYSNIYSMTYPSDNLFYTFCYDINNDKVDFCYEQNGYYYKKIFDFDIDYFTLKIVNKAEYIPYSEYISKIPK